MKTLNAMADTEQKLEVGVDYDRPYAELVASLPGLSEGIRRVLNQEPNWCILRHREWPRGISTVQVTLCPSSDGVSALQLLNSRHLRPVFFPEFAALLALQQSRTLNLPCLGSLWCLNHSQVKLLLCWETGTLQMHPHRTPFMELGIFLPAIVHDDVSSLMRIPI
ncbi:MAG: hypothetical protein ABIH36_00530 [bacterium]